MGGNMKKVLELLNEKNFYLERFLEESKKERGRFKARRFENLDSLYQKREQILAYIHSIDSRIGEICENNGEELLAQPNKKDVQELLSKIKTNVRSIMEEDIEIISYIENEKTKIIREISQTREGRRALNGYKAI